MQCVSAPDLKVRLRNWSAEVTPSIYELVDAAGQFLQMVSTLHVCSQT